MFTPVHAHFRKVGSAASPNYLRNMNSVYLPGLFERTTTSGTVTADAEVAAHVLKLVKRLGEQRSHRFGHMEHTEVELVLARLDRLAELPGFEDLHHAALAGFRIWYHLPERKLDRIAYRTTPSHTVEVVEVSEGMR